MLFGLKCELFGLEKEEAWLHLPFEKQNGRVKFIMIFVGDK